MSPRLYPLFCKLDLEVGFSKSVSDSASITSRSTQPTRSSFIDAKAAVLQRITPEGLSVLRQADGKKVVLSERVAKHSLPWPPPGPFLGELSPSRDQSRAPER